MTDNIIEARRAGFEAWHCEKFKTKRSTGMPTRDMHNGKYDDDYGPQHQQEMWEAYNAALDSACVELPCRIAKPENPITALAAAGYNSLIARCEEAIHAAGVRTK